MSPGTDRDRTAGDRSVSGAVPRRLSVAPRPWWSASQKRAAPAGWLDQKATWLAEDRTVEATSISSLTTRAVVTGPLGTGKTMLFREIVSRWRALPYHRKLRRPMPMTVSASSLAEEHALGRVAAAELRRGDLLLLVDDVDELEPERRIASLEGLLELIAEYPACRVLVATRHAADVAALFPAVMHQFELLPPTIDEIARWCAAEQDEARPVELRTYRVLLGSPEFRALADDVGAARAAMRCFARRALPTTCGEFFEQVSDAPDVAHRSASPHLGATRDARRLLDDPGAVVERLRHDPVGGRHLFVAWCSLSAGPVDDVVERVREIDPCTALAGWAAHGHGDHVGAGVERWFGMLGGACPDPRERVKALADAASRRTGAGLAVLAALERGMRAADPDQRDLAADALAQSGTAAAADILADHLADSSALGERLAAMGDVAVTPLSRLARDGCRAAVAALGRIMSPECSSVLGSLVWADSRTATAAAWALLGALGDPELERRLSADPGRAAGHANDIVRLRERVAELVGDPDGEPPIDVPDVRDSALGLSIVAARSWFYGHEWRPPGASTATSRVPLPPAAAESARRLVHRERARRSHGPMPFPRVVLTLPVEGDPEPDSEYAEELAEVLLDVSGDDPADVRDLDRLCRHLIDLYQGPTNLKALIAALPLPARRAALAMLLARRHATSGTKNPGAVGRRRSEPVLPHRLGLSGALVALASALLGSFAAATGMWPWGPAWLAWVCLAQLIVFGPGMLVAVWNDREAWPGTLLGWLVMPLELLGLLLPAREWIRSDPPPSRLREAGELLLGTLVTAVVPSMAVWAAWTVYQVAGGGVLIVVSICAVVLVRYVMLGTISTDESPAGDELTPFLRVAGLTDLR